MHLPRSAWPPLALLVGILLAVVVGLVLWRGTDNALNRDAVNVLALLAGGIIGSYVFGAAWERTKGVGL
jgi:hypothetical protein